MRFRLVFPLRVVLAIFSISYLSFSIDPRVITEGVTTAQVTLMTSTWDEVEGKLSIFRSGQLVAVYQRDTQNGRSIANAITELYAVGHPNDNLVSDSSPLVPPHILVGIQDDLISDTCFNDPTNTFSCDYFAHHDPVVEIIQAGGSAVRFRTWTTHATQHNDKGTPIAYGSDMTITVPYHPEQVVVEYDVRTSLQQPVNVRYALRPLPFFELVNDPYISITYLNADCQGVITTTIPTTGGNLEFLQQWPVCSDRPWAAIYHNNEGNLGMILQSWRWSSGTPKLTAYTETGPHPQRPNLYFQSNDVSRRYDAGIWNGCIIFIAYTNTSDYTPVQQFRNMLSNIFLPLILK